MRTVAIIATAGALTLMLTGCFGNPVESIVEQAIEDQTGVEVSAGGEDGVASLPSDWPSEVPVPEGKLLLALSMDGSYSATIELGDEDAGMAGLDTYLLAGFAITSEADYGGLKSYQLSNPNYDVNYSFGPDADGVYVANLVVIASTQ
jgi:hypothetical protein